MRGPVRDRVPSGFDRPTDRDPRAEAVRLRAVRRRERARFERVRGRDPESAASAGARRDHRIRPRRHGVRPRSRFLRIPPGRVRGAGPSRRHDGARHPSLPPASRGAPGRDPGHPGHGRRAAHGSGARSRLLAGFAEGRGVRVGVPGRRVHAGAGPEHPGRRARRRAPRRRLPLEREPRIPGRAWRRRRGDRWRQRRPRRGPHRSARDRGGAVDDRPVR